MDSRDPMSEREGARDPDEILSEVEKEAREPVSEARANRFYDRLRARLTSSVPGKGGRLQDLLFFAPDIFILLWRLTRDERVTGKNKAMLGSALAYFIFPLDLMPDLLGPLGFADDLIFGVYVLNRMLVDTDEQVLRDHWSGTGDVLGVIRQILKAADGLVAGDMLKAIKRMVK
jgi:uncharacterized membrane protein YkvA (DUF1232 family)